MPRGRGASDERDWALELCFPELRGVEIAALIQLSGADERLKLPLAGRLACYFETNRFICKENVPRIT